MTLARLLTATLLVCCLSALAQNRQAQATAALPPACREIWTGCPVQGNIIGSKIFFFLDPTTAATAWQPLTPTSKRPADAPSGYNALDPERLDEYRFDQIKGDPHIRGLKLEALDADATCYTIRTYVVARDSKDSDSTHPAGYSTCQPSAQYQLKTTLLRSRAQDR